LPSSLHVIVVITPFVTGFIGDGLLNALKVMFINTAVTSVLTYLRCHERIAELNK